MPEELSHLRSDSLVIFNDELCLSDEALTGIADTESEIGDPVKERTEVSCFLELWELLAHQSVRQMDLKCLSED